MEIDDIKKLMKNKKITQVKLAEISGIPIDTLRQIFSGKTKYPRLDTINTICDALGINYEIQTQPTILNSNFRLGIKNKIFVFDNSGDKYEFEFNKDELNRILKICGAVSIEKK